MMFLDYSLGYFFPGNMKKKNAVQKIMRAAYQSSKDIGRESREGPRLGLCGPGQSPMGKPLENWHFYTILD